MFLDASVIVAILANESDASELARRLDVADVRLTSPLAIWEATVAMVRIGRLTPGDAKFLVTELIASWGGEVIALDERIGSAAIEAFDAFGRGRHRAAHVDLELGAHGGQRARHVADGDVQAEAGRAAAARDLAR